jgi:hypothetical protein
MSKTLHDREITMLVNNQKITEDHARYEAKRMAKDEDKQRKMVRQAKHQMLRYTDAFYGVK